MQKRSLMKSSSASQRRTCTKLIRLSTEELRTISDRARLSGRPVACYIRESSLGPAPRVRRTDVSDLLIRALAQVATRLAALATAAKARDLPDADAFEVAVSDVLDVIRSLD